MKKLIVFCLMLMIMNFSYSTDVVNEIVDNRDIFNEKDLEEIKTVELTLPEVNKKISELETKSILDGEKLVKMEQLLQEKTQQVENLENKVENLIFVVNTLDEKNKNFTSETISNINGKIYKSLLLIFSILIGVTIILIGIIMLQNNKNKKIIEECQEFFQMNVDRLKLDKEKTSSRDEFEL